MVKSRLHLRRKKVIISVKAKTLASGQYTEATVSGLGALVATREQVDAMEISDDAGAIVIVSDTFWFESKPGGSLPAIEEKHILIDTSDVRYEVVQVANQGGEGDMLRVMTRKLR